jgi:hypothetical protein
MVNVNVEPFATSLVTQIPSAVELDELPAQRQPEACSLRFLVRFVGTLRRTPITVKCPEEAVKTPFDSCT